MDNLPNVILLAGLTDNHTMWDFQVDALSDIAKPIALGLVNHETVSDCAEWMLDTIPKKFALVGFSMGGYVAFEIMKRAPERVTKLALIGTSARADTLEKKVDRDRLIALTNAGEYETVLDALIPSALHSDRAAKFNLINAIKCMAMQVGPEAFIRQLKMIQSRPDSRPFLPNITCPTTVICGTCDAITPPELSRELIDGIKGAELTLIEDCGHYCSLEWPDIVTSTLRRWLTSA